ncbi:hypothetical protein [Demequina maris]|uniref:hypothetical protein n=1 Tax=Demequina maris TaxID=1638982 RepID=UPI000784C925|nr:hypothetical protein [Demequina maris]
MAMQEHEDPEQRALPSTYGMQPAELDRYARLLAHADDPSVAAMVGYSPQAAPVAWQAWELAARFSNSGDTESRAS